jgi:pimeloyl-ACP methyl ester carboxylesterase
MVLRPRPLPFATEWRALPCMRWYRTLQPMHGQGSPLAALERWRAAQLSFVHKGRSIAYWTAGEGPALLLIHGFPTASFDWWKVWDALAARFRVVAADMLGFGFSDKPVDDAYLIADQASLQEALAAHLGLARTHVLAHDYGVSVAQELLARQDEGGAALAIDSVIYLNGGLFPETHRPTAGQLVLASEAGEAVAAQITRDTFAAGIQHTFGPASQPSAEEFDALWAVASLQDGHKLMWKVLNYMRQRRENRERWVGALNKALVPQRLINGPEDPASGRHVAEHYSAQVRDADVVMLEGVGHWPQIEAPDATLAAVFAFHDRL